MTKTTTTKMLIPNDKKWLSNCEQYESIDYIKETSTRLSFSAVVFVVKQQANIYYSGERWVPVTQKCCAVCRYQWVRLIGSLLLPLLLLLVLLLLYDLMTVFVYASASVSVSLCFYFHFVSLCLLSSIFCHSRVWQFVVRHRCCFVHFFSPWPNIFRNQKLISTMDSHFHLHFLLLLAGATNIYSCGALKAFFSCLPNSIVE